jgi:drug/metabolite transporter (DMT)-like permease
LLVLMVRTADTCLMITNTPAPETGRQPVAASWRVLAAISFTVLAWASAFVVIRFVGRDYSPGGLSLGRLAIGSVCLSVIMLVGRRWVPMGRRDWGLVVLIGIAWFGVYNVALNAGEQRVDAGTAAMLIQLAPILIGVLAGLLLGEGFPRMLVVGGLVAFAGTLIIGIATSTGHADIAGVLLVLLAAAVYAVAVVAQKVVLRRVPGLQVTWLACLIGTAACLPFLPALITDVQNSTSGATLGMVYLGVVPTASAFLTWAYALARSDAGRLGATTYAVPPIAIALGWIFLGEVPAVLAIVGGAVSLVGVGIARRKPKPVVAAAAPIEG